MQKKLLALILAALPASPAFAGVRVVVPAHDIARGATISETDLTYSTVGNTVMSGVATSVDEIAGMEARRTLRAGETLRSLDVRRPVIVNKGSMVTMLFVAPGIVLTATGRAISQGGLGETVTVQNPVSFRQITAVVVGPGQVRAETGAARFASIEQ